MTIVHNQSSNGEKPHKAHRSDIVKRQTWLPSDEETITKMMVIKKLSRYRKNQALNAFVLVRNQKEDEFNSFLLLLQQNIMQIPQNTRMSLAVRTLLYDPLYDTKPDLWELTKKSPKHWTAVDILVDKQKRVHSFVLDAANSVGYHGMHHALKTMFPDGKHYVFEEDVFIAENELPKTRVIQTQYRGCHIFTLTHLNNLSNIDTHTLYDVELPMLAAKNKDGSGMIKPGYFSGSLALAKIFIPTQSISTLESLAIKDAMVSQKGQPLSLINAAKAKSIITADGFVVNEANYIKNERYIEKEANSYAFSRLKTMQIMNVRQGYIFLKNRSLFNLNAALKELKNTQHMRLFVEKLYDILSEEKAIYHHMKRYIDELKPLFVSDLYPLEDIKYNLMFTMENMFLNIDAINRSDLNSKCNKHIELTLFVYFDYCKQGIINANRTLLWTKYPCLSKFKTILQSICWFDELHVFTRNLNQFVDGRLDLYQSDINQLILLLDDHQMSIETTKDKLLFQIECLFFYILMKDDNKFDTELTHYILSLQPFSLVIEDTMPLQHSLVSVTTQSIFQKNVPIESVYFMENRNGLTKVGSNSKPK